MARLVETASLGELHPFRSHVIIPEIAGIDLGTGEWSAQQDAGVLRSELRRLVGISIMLGMAQPRNEITDQQLLSEFEPPLKAIWVLQESLGFVPFHNTVPVNANPYRIRRTDFLLRGAVWLANGELGDIEPRDYLRQFEHTQTEKLTMQVQPEVSVLPPGVIDLATFREGHQERRPLPSDLPPGA